MLNQKDQNLVGSFIDFQAEKLALMCTVELVRSYPLLLETATSTEWQVMTWTI